MVRRMQNAKNIQKPSKALLLEFEITRIEYTDFGDFTTTLARGLGFGHDKQEAWPKWQSSIESQSRFGECNVAPGTSPVKEIEDSAAPWRFDEI